MKSNSFGNRLLVLAGKPGHLLLRQVADHLWGKEIREKTDKLLLYGKVRELIYKPLK